MIKSMTGFARLKGGFGVWNWDWDIRAVNARGFDLRMRLPEWIDGLDTATRRAVGGVVHRGNLTVSVKMSRSDEEGSATIDPRALDRALALISRVETAAAAADLSLATTRAADVLGMRGVLSVENPDEDFGDLAAALAADLQPLIEAFDKMRRSEGAALAVVLAEQIDRIEVLAGEAAVLAEARKDRTAERLQANLARILGTAEGVDPDRVAQELALIAVKTDVTEEIDRLRAHVAGARALLQEDGAVGRKFDFLAQEFNREANTLCSKSQSSELTRVGLDLKAVIDQMREQIQNVE